MQTLFVVLQSILLVLFLLQDTVHLPPLNNQASLLKILGWTKIIIGTLITSGCVGASLFATLQYANAPLPLGVKIFFVFWWGMMLYGMYWSWYKPYIFGPTEKELENYQAYHGGTHTFLPKRKGFSGPNTLHVFLHIFMIPCAVLGFLKVAGVF